MVWGRGIIAALLAAGTLVPRPGMATPAHSAWAFPPGFIWGTATAAVQVEGGTVHSDWEAFQRRPHQIRDDQRIGAAARQWDLYEQDFAAAAAMHTNGYRMSLEWSRLEPARGQWDEAAFRHYRLMLESLHRHGIRPMITLHHFSNPDWVAAQGGWLNPRTIDDYAAFVDKVARAYGDLVDDWVTFNEPTLYVCEGYLRGTFPPGEKDQWDKVPRALTNIAKAHARAYHLLHARDRSAAFKGDPPVRVGIAEHQVAFQPEASWNPLDHLVAFVSDSWFNHTFLDAATSGQIRFVGGLSYSEDVPDLVHTLDFVGVNYYTRSLSSILAPGSHICPEGCALSDLGLEIYPDGLAEVLEAVYARYKLPVVISETGIADARRDRTPIFMVRHLERIAEAIAAGVPVGGVYWWSLIDNFEWQNGYYGRFGLLAVDFSDPNRPRRWTPAAHVYGAIARANALTPDLIARYGDNQAIASAPGKL